MMNEFEDSLLNELLENLDEFLEKQTEEIPVHTSTSESSDDEHIPQVVHVRKRPYKRKIVQNGHGQVVTLPRRIRNDIRLSYAQMYANVLNSADHPLMVSFFERFFTPQTKMTKDPTAMTAPRAEITGSNLLAYYFLILAQSAPDFATAVLNVKLKPKSRNSEAEISCILRVSHTLFYDIKPGALAKSVLDEYYNTPSLLEGNDAEGSRKRKIPSDTDNLLHPFTESGNFYETRFPRLPNPMAVTGECLMRMKINDEKQITQLISGPLELTPSTANLCKYY